MIFNLSSTPSPLNSISVVSSETTYTYGDTIDENALTVTATYVNNTSKVVTGFELLTTTASIDGAITGTQVCTVSYTERGITKTATFNITVNVPIASISVLTQPTNRNFNYNESVDLSGLTLTVVYENEYTNTIASGYTFSPTVATSETITISYGGKTTTTPIVISYASALTYNPSNGMSVTENRGSLWTVNITKSGTLTVAKGFAVDLFLCGGGGGGAGGYYYHEGTSGYARICGSGGGGGYTKTQKNVSIPSGSYSVTIGAGGAGGAKENGKVGGATSVTINGTTYTANGGNGGTQNGSGGNGGSGGGGCGGSSGYTSRTNWGGGGGSNGGNGGDGQFHGSSESAVYVRYGGTGQGTTTKSFGETSGALYASGGSGASTSSVGSTGTATAGNGGGGSYTTVGKDGTDGAILIRSHR